MQTLQKRQTTPLVALTRATFLCTRRRHKLLWHLPQGWAHKQFKYPTLTKQRPTLPKSGSFDRLRSQNPHPGGMFARRATFVLGILSPAPSLSSPREVRQVDHTSPSLQGTSHKPKYENSTTQNVTPTTSNHIVINWVQRMGQILRHSKKVLQIVW